MHTLSLLRAGKLSGCKRLDLSCGLNNFPREIFDLADSLEILNLSGNTLSGLPDDLPRLKNLRVIFCSDNKFTTVPEILGQCEQLETIGFKANQISNVPASALPKKLRWLILTDNLIAELPSELGSCSSLQKLMLAGNRLQYLPSQLANCEQLELLRISANRLQKLPECLLSLPRLSWLAFAGNPFSEPGEAEASLQQPINLIDWSSLEIEYPLGEGASGVIYRANQKLAGPASSLAVKIFKSALTSDGLPRSEMAACIAAGAHSGLIPVIGKVSGHPEEKSGLVMALIDADFINLAGPPSLESCTRDIYPPETRFNLLTILNILKEIAAVADHLHTLGILHGDLYAHNILWNKNGDCLVGDFGAASFVPKNNVRLAKNLQCIEVRAFACLIGELLERCNVQIRENPIIEILQNIESSCAQPDVKARPRFDEIRRLLDLAKHNHDEVSKQTGLTPA